MAVSTARPQSSDLVTSETTETADPPSASILTRVASAHSNTAAAVAIDLIIFGVPILLLSNVVLGPELIGDEGVSAQGFYSMDSLLQAMFLTLVTILLWVKWDGRTPGKKVLGLRIVTYPEYRQLSYATAAMRALLSVTGTLTIGVGYLLMALMIGARVDKRGYHDLLAGTCVIRDE